MLRDFLLQRGLSNREVEVAELVSKGLANKEVADRLFVTEKTVKFHLTNIYKKMNIKSRSQLIVWCLPHLRIQEEDEATVDNTTTQRIGGMQTAPIRMESSDLVAGNGNMQSSMYDARIDELPNGLKTFK